MRQEKRHEEDFAEVAAVSAEREPNGGCVVVVPVIEMKNLHLLHFYTAKT